MVSLHLTTMKGNRERTCRGTYLGHLNRVEQISETVKGRLHPQLAARVLRDDLLPEATQDG